MSYRAALMNVSSVYRLIHNMTQAFDACVTQCPNARIDSNSILASLTQRETHQILLAQV